MDYIKELEERLIEVITDLEQVKEKNYNFKDSKGDKMVYMDIDHIDYLIKTLKGGNINEYINRRK